MTSSTLFRQWTMLRMIPRHPRKITVRDLAARLEQQGFPVTERTVQRDLQALSGELFALTVDDRSRPYGWQWARGAEAMDIPGMEPQTALAFKLAERFLSPLLAPSTLGSLEPHLRQAERVLRSVGGSPRTWPDTVRIVTREQSLTPPEVDPEVLMVAYDSRFAEDQRRSRSEDGGAEIRATVPDTLQLRWWLLGLGSNVEVLGPEATGQYG